MNSLKGGLVTGTEMIEILRNEYIHNMCYYSAIHGAVAALIGMAIQQPTRRDGIHLAST